MNTLFSTRLKSLRKERGENQETVAEYLGIQRTTYSGYERGTIVPPYSKIHKLAERYNVSVDYLMGQTNFENYNFNKSEIPDVAEQLLIICDELMSDVSAVTCKGTLLTNEEKKQFLPFINSCINMIDLVTLYKKEKK